MRDRTFSTGLGSMLCVVLAMLVLSPVSEGALIENGTYTTDTATGLDSLDLNATLGMSYSGVLAPGGIAEAGGWRHATPSEYVALISSQTSIPIDTVVQALVVPPPEQFVTFRVYVGSRECNAFTSTTPRSRISDPLATSVRCAKVRACPYR